MRVPDEQRNEIAVGDEFAVGDFTVHVTGTNDPDAIEPVGSYRARAGDVLPRGDSRPAEAWSDVGERLTCVGALRLALLCSV